MFAEEPGKCPVGRQLPGVPKNEPVAVNADLDRDAAAVILVDDRIEESLAQGGPGKRVALDALQPLVADGGLEVFEIYQLQCFFDLLEEIAPDDVLVEKVVVGDEEADLDIDAGAKSHGGEKHFLK